jgi:hypothetical protein
LIAQEGREKEKKKIRSDEKQKKKERKIKTTEMCLFGGVQKGRGSSHQVIKKQWKH